MTEKEILDRNIRERRQYEEDLKSVEQRSWRQLMAGLQRWAQLSRITSRAPDATSR